MASVHDSFGTILGGHNFWQPQMIITSKNLLLIKNKPLLSNVHSMRKSLLSK